MVNTIAYIYIKYSTTMYKLIRFDKRNLLIGYTRYFVILEIKYDSVVN